MSEFDITVAVTARDETLIAGPALRSADIAIDAAVNAGLRVERLVGLDCPTRDCREFFYQPGFDHWPKIEYEEGDPYRTRNRLVHLASGKWIAFLDADDLFSHNWLINAAKLLKEADEAGEAVIVHPELNWIFEGANKTFVKVSQGDQLFLPHYFYFANYYDMLSVAPRAAALDIPYAPRDLETGFGYQDWQWNIETMAAGWRHIVATNTIIFKRRRRSSVSVLNGFRKAVVRDLESMAIDNVAHLGRPSSQPAPPRRQLRARVKPA